MNIETALIKADQSANDLYLQACIALAILAGDNYHRMGALIGGVKRSVATRILQRVVHAINTELKEEYLRFPTSAYFI